MTNNAGGTFPPLICHKVKSIDSSSSGSSSTPPPLRLTMSRNHDHRALFQSSNTWAVTYTDNTSKLYPIYIDFSEFKTNPNKNIVLLKDHTSNNLNSTCAVILKLAWRRLPSFKCYTLHPNSEGQAPSKYQKHAAGTLYAYAEVSDTGSMYKTTRTFTKQYSVTLHSSGGNKYDLELSGTNESTRISNLKMVLSDTKTKQKIASATQLGSGSLPSGYRVEITAAGHDPAAILALLVMVHELFPLTTV